VQGNVYLRKFRQSHLDGNDGNFERCSNASSFPNRLCLEDDGFPRPNPVTTAFRDQFVILDQNNNPIPCPPGSVNTCATVPYGTLDRTKTEATTVGASLQASNNDKIAGHDNHFTVGGSIDHSRVNFQRDQRTRVHLSRSVDVIQRRDPGMGSIVHSAANIGYGRVTRSAQHLLWALRDRYVRHYLAAFGDGGARLNVAKITVSTSSALSPNSIRARPISRVNPVFGLTYKILLNLDLRRLFGIEPRSDSP
jgi:iron complex outermembrane receptor protein